MAYVPLEKMIDKNPSIYKLVLVAAERANELLEGSKPLIETQSKKSTTIALQEVFEGKVYYKSEESEEE